MSDQAVQAWIDEAHRQAENCAYTATSFTIWLRFLRGVQTFCVVSPVVFGALATWKILTVVPIWAAVFTLLATVIPPAYRASKVDKEIKDCAHLAGEFTNLRDRFRQAALVTSQRPFAEFDSEVRQLMDRLELARQRVLAPPEWCFRLARKKHKAEHYVHDYDER